MQIENGKFYFISNEFINKYGLKFNLMQNKETGNKRPCYFCFKDKLEEDIAELLDFYSPKEMPCVVGAISNRRCNSKIIIL